MFRSPNTPQNQVEHDAAAALDYIARYGFCPPEEQAALRTLMTPCGQCMGCAQGDFCDERWVPMLTNAQMKNRLLLIDGRNYGAGKDLPGALWIAEVFLKNAKRRVRVRRKSDSGNWEELDLPVEELFLPSDDVIDGGDAETFAESLRSRFDDFFRPLDENARVFVTRQRWEHARAVLTLLAIEDPEAFVRWGHR